MGGPAQRVEDTACVGCNDPYDGIDLVDGACFGCRYKLATLERTPLKLRGW